jgi:ribosomal protein S18 acetylase RimI-like enzyme
VEKEPRIHEFIKLFFRTPGNPYSNENVIVEEEDSRIRGLILAYPAIRMKKMSKEMSKCIKEMARISGVTSLIKMMFRLKLNRYFPGTEDDELFISNLAIFEEYRGRGIATKLLGKAEEMAQEAGLNKLSLYVEIDNTHAKNVYEKIGYREVKKVVLPERYNKHNLFGFYKMVKELEEN